MADQSDTSEDTQVEDGATPVDDVHEQAMERFDSVIVAVQEERALALEDRRFVSIAGAQWEGVWGEQFENSIMVEVNKTAQGVEKIEGDYRSNRMIVNFRGVDKGASEETAETMNGMFRADFYVSKGQQAADNAFTEAVQGGMGAWRLLNVPEDPYDPDNERQRIAFGMIGDADQSVFWDPNSRLMDKSDAEWCIVVTAMAKAAYERKYKGKLTEWPQGLMKYWRDWFTPDVIRVAEYYVVEFKPEERYTLRNRATGEERNEWRSDLPEGALSDLDTEGWQRLRTRRIKRKRVKKYVLSGAEILKPGVYVAGTEIPIVPVYGKRWWIDNMERSRGHVRLAKDPQRIYNANVSKLVETNALAPIERPIVDPEQVQGYEDEWADMNISRRAYVRLRALRNDDGSIAAAGPVGSIQPPQLSPVQGALLQISSSDITEITASDDGAAQTQSNVSAEAMDIAATRTDAKSGIYMDNMKQAWARCGEIWQSMARDVYFEEGREVETMGDDGEQGTAVLAEPHTDERGRYSIRNDITKGKYRVFADVTEATATRRDKTVKTLLNGAQVVAAFDPELAGMMTTTAILQLDGEGINDLQDALRKRALASGLVKPTPEEQQEMEAAAQEPQEPDPQSEFLLATAAEKRASAAQKEAAVDQTKADTALKVAQAAKTQSEIGQGEQTHKLGLLDRMKEGAKSFFSPKPNSGKPAGPEARQ
jgi:hypothetical protein